MIYILVRGLILIYFHKESFQLRHRYEKCRLIA